MARWLRCTEIGVLVRNSEVARSLAEAVDEGLAANAYRLVLVALAREGGAEACYADEPLASTWRRFKAWFLSLLPIEPLL